jgi:hypothetical protein
MSNNAPNRGPPDDSLVDQFRNPDREYGPVPLWWWDGDQLNEDRISFQLEELRDGGVRSVCIIQKYPNGPNGEDQIYFSEEWWEYVEYTAQECERLGMDLWVHDETFHLDPKSPWEYWQDYIKSETTAHPEFQGWVLDCVSADVTGESHVHLDLPSDLELLSVAAYPRRDDGSINLEEAIEINPNPGDNAIEWLAPQGDWHVAAICYRPEGLCYTTRDVVDRYIEIHYEEYRRRLGDLVGDVLVGTFEDELVLLDKHIPCDQNVLQRFRKTKGYDPVPQLVGLYEDIGPTTTAIRTDFYDVVITLIEENWFKPLFDWHEKHGLLRSHDNWGRNNLSAGIVQYGDYFRTMRWYQAPGYDDGFPPSLGSRNFFDAKLASSIAACYNRPRVWGELFHSTGWSFSPESQLAGIAENYCYGANLYDKAILYYATLGGWFEWAPPDIHFRQPYWDHVDGLNEAISRLSLVFSQGQPVVDAAMLYPSTSLHADWSPDDGIGSIGQKIDKKVREISEELYKTGTDLIIADHESIAEADIRESGLDISGMHIPILILGPTTVIQKTTLQTAKEFYDQGGIILAVGQLPTIAVGQNDTKYDISEELQHIFGPEYQAAETGAIEGYHINENARGGAGILADSDTGLTDLVDSQIERDIRVSESDIYHTHHRFNDKNMYLLFNTHDKERAVTVKLRAKGQPQLWDAINGDIEQVSEYDYDGTYTVFNLSFAPNGFHVVVVEPDGNPPRVVESTLTNIDRVESTSNEIVVTGWTKTPGLQSGRTIHDGQEYSGESEPISIPDTIDLSEGWEFHLEPNLSNEWGDFRYPPDSTVLKPEIRKFQYRQESPSEDGIDKGWYRPDIEAGNWQTVRWSYGPYFWVRTGSSDDLRTHEKPKQAPDKWSPYNFSKVVGKPGTHPYRLGYTSVLSDNYLRSPEGDGLNYFWTTARPAEEGNYSCHYGPGIERIAIGEHNIDVEPDPKAELPDISDLRNRIESFGGGTTVIHLPEGPTSILLAVEPDIETYFAVETPGENLVERDMAYTPRLRWFHQTDSVEFDYIPWRESPVGWYRFDLPVGACGFSLPIRGEARVWVNGNERAVTEGEVTLSNVPESQVPVAVRVEQQMGAYAGATWSNPISIDFGEITIDTTDWMDLGLVNYSGRGRYRTTFSLPEIGPEDRVMLDLGDVSVTASVTINGTPVGTKFARPFKFDISNAVQIENNAIEVTVANTVANHFAEETPREYIETARHFADSSELLPSAGKERFSSGLLGPVTVQIKPSVTIPMTQ